MSGLDSLFGVAKFLMSSNNEKLNTINKGISECGQVNPLALMQGSFGMNTIVSGTAQFVRNIMTGAQVKCALSGGLPVVMLHSCNSELANEVLTSSVGYSCAIVNTSSANFSPFIGLNDYEAIDIIMDSIPEKYDLKQNGRYYLEAVTDLMTANRISSSFKNYLTCPHDNLLDRVDNALVAGKLTVPAAQSIKSKIMVGQSEYFKIDSFLRGLSKQMGNAMLNKKVCNKPASVYKTISEKGIIAIDVGPNFNSIYLDFLVEQIKVAAQRGIPFMLVLDSMRLSENKKIKELISGGINNIPIVISCDDLVSSCGGNQDLFNAVVGSAKQLFVFSHPSATSASYWAAVMGEYERIDESVSKTKDTTERVFSAASMYYPEPRRTNRTVSTSKRRDFVVPPEKITSMQNNEFFAKSMTFRGTRHGYIVRP